MTLLHFLLSFFFPKVPPPSSSHEFTYLNRYISPNASQSTQLYFSRSCDIIPNATSQTTSLHQNNLSG